MNDAKVAAYCSIPVLLFLLWSSVGVLLKNEVFLTDDDGKVTSHFRRAEQPLKYWGVVAINWLMIAGCIALEIWQFG
jgi:hypothetical protein